MDLHHLKRLRCVRFYHQSLFLDNVLIESMFRVSFPRHFINGSDIIGVIMVVHQYEEYSAIANQFRSNVLLELSV